MNSELTIPALSILQPWAGAIACGAKHIETRRWQTHYRGPLLIHAGLNRAGVHRTLRTRTDSPQGQLFEAGMAALRAAKVRWVDVPWWHGAIIAVAELVDCCPITMRNGAGLLIRYHGAKYQEVSAQETALGDYTPGRYGWVLANVAPLTAPVPFKGHQGLFRVPLEAVRHALPAEWAAKMEAPHE